MNPNNPLQQLQSALQQLTGSNQMLPSGPTQPTQASPDQSQGMDVNQMFSNLLTHAFQNKGKPRKYNAIAAGQISPLEMDNQHPIESQATMQAIRNGADPALLDQARQFLGKNAFVGLCEAFVERMTKGAEGLYASAKDAWNQQTNKQSDLANIQPGDSVYFAPDASNQYYGHTGVYSGNNKFISATYNGVKEYDLNDWQKNTGQKVLGYVPSNAHNVPPGRATQPSAPKQTSPVQQPIQQPTSPMAKPPMQLMGFPHPETGQVVRKPFGGMT